VVDESQPKGKCGKPRILSEIRPDLPTDWVKLIGQAGDYRIERRGGRWRSGWSLAHSASRKGDGARFKS
jgi:hypothetical protein